MARSAKKKSARKSARRESKRNSRGRRSSARRNAVFRSSRSNLMLELPDELMANVLLHQMICKNNSTITLRDVLLHTSGQDQRENKLASNLHYTNKQLKSQITSVVPQIKTLITEEAKACSTDSRGRYNKAPNNSNYWHSCSPPCVDFTLQYLIELLARVKPLEGGFPSREFEQNIEYLKESIAKFLPDDSQHAKFFHAIDALFSEDTTPQVRPPSNYGEEEVEYARFLAHILRIRKIPTDNFPEAPNKFASWWFNRAIASYTFRNTQLNCHNLSMFIKVNVGMLNLWLEGLAFSPDEAHEIAEALKINAVIRSICINGCILHPRGVIHIANAIKINRSLTSLFMVRDQINDDGAIAIGEALKENPAITHLNLNVHDIGNDGAIAIAEALKVNTGLKHLQLHHNKIGDEGALAIGEALKVNTALTELNLEHNIIGVEGATAIGEALKVNTALTTLNLQDNNIECNGAYALGEGISHNENIRFLLVPQQFVDIISTISRAKMRVAQVQIYNDY